MKVYTTEKAPAAIGPYSQAIEANGFLFASGQIPIVPATGALAAGDITVQAEQVMKNVGAILQAAGADYTDVVKTTCFWLTWRILPRLMRCMQNILPGSQRAPVWR